MALSGKVVKCDRCGKPATVRFNRTPLCEGCYFDKLLSGENSFFAARKGVRGLIRFMKAYL